MNSWKIILATMVIFGAGVLTGGLLVNYVERGHEGNARFPFWRPNPQLQMRDREQLPPGELPHPPSPEMSRKDFLGRLDKTLKLTPEQHAAIAKIIAEGQERNWQIWTNVALPQIRQEMEQVRQRIRAELTPEQQKKFAAMVKQFELHHPPHNPMPPGPPRPANNVSPSPPGGETGP
ncbi:MAG TPA: hypothetical protein VMA13_03630 [Candidatus Saccharimonadales bacterium]|nr:hypothetical protein [Candidatus Saccharimonadales bacterium]